MSKAIDLDAISVIKEAVAAKQDLLVSGENIKTINGKDLLGPGNLNTPTVVQSTGTSTSSVMSQNAVTSHLPTQYPDLVIPNSSPSQKITSSGLLVEVSTAKIPNMSLGVKQLHLLLDGSPNKQYTVEVKIHIVRSNGSEANYHSSTYDVSINNYGILLMDDYTFTTDGVNISDGDKVYIMLSSPQADGNLGVRNGYFRFNKII